MKFSCETCKARYNVADEKVRGKVVRVHCRACESSITIDGTALEGNGSTSAGGRVVGAGGASAKPERKKTRTKSGGERLEGKKASETAGQIGEGWHAVIGREQEGPLGRAELEEAIRKGRLTKKTYVWREDLGKWRPAGSVSVLAELLEAAGAAEAPDGPPDPTEEKEEDEAGAADELDDVFRDKSLADEPAAEDALAQFFEEKLEDVKAGSAPDQDGLPRDDDPFAAELAREAALSRSAGSFSGDFDSRDEGARETTETFILASGVKQQRSPGRVAAFVVGLAGLFVALGFVATHLGFVDLSGLVQIGGERRKAEPWEAKGGDTALRDLLLGLGKEDDEPEQEPEQVEPVKVAVGETEAEQLRREELEAERESLDPERREMLADLYRRRDREAVTVRAKVEPAEPARLEADELPIDPEVIHRRLIEAQPAFENCVQQEIRRNPRFTGGRWDMVLAVAPSGVVREASFEERALDRSDIGRCIARAARRMMLPSFSGEEPIDIVVPLVLSVPH